MQGRVTNAVGERTIAKERSRTRTAILDSREAQRKLIQTRDHISRRWAGSRWLPSERGQLTHSRHRGEEDVLQEDEEGLLMTSRVRKRTREVGRKLTKKKNEENCVRSRKKNGCHPGQMAYWGHRDRAPGGRSRDTRCGHQTTRL